MSWNITHEKIRQDMQDTKLGEVRELEESELSCPCRNCEMRDTGSHCHKDCMRYDEWITERNLSWLGA